LDAEERVMKDLAELETLAQRCIERGDPAEAAIYRNYIESVRQMFCKELNDVYEAAVTIREFIHSDAGEEQDVATAVETLVQYVGDEEHPLLEFVEYQLKPSAKTTGSAAETEVYQVRQKSVLTKREDARYYVSFQNPPPAWVRTPEDTIVIQVQRGKKTHRLYSGLHRADNPKAQLVQNLLGIY
jgi:hypothetical protein